MSERRQELIDRAAPILRRQGVRRTSLNALCRELRIAKKTFYVCFENMDELVRAIAQQTQLAYATAAQTAAAGASDDFQRARNVLVALCEVSATRLSAVFFADLVELYPDVGETLLEGRRRIVQSVVTWLQTAQQQGTVRSDVDLELVQSLATVVVDRVLDPTILQQRGLPLEASARTLIGVWMDGLQARPSRTLRNTD